MDNMDLVIIALDCLIPMTSRSVGNNLVRKQERRYIYSVELSKLLYSMSFGPNAMTEEPLSLRDCLASEKIIQPEFNVRFLQEGKRNKGRQSLVFLPLCPSSIIPEGQTYSALALTDKILADHEIPEALQSDLFVKVRLAL